MPRNVFLLLSVAVLLWCGFQSRHVSHAAPPSLEEKIQRERGHLERLKQEIRDTQKQVEQTQRQHDAVLQSIETLDRRLYQQQKEFRAISRDIRNADRELRTLNQKVSALKASLDQREETVKTRLRRLYMEGQSGWYRPLLSSGTYSQFQRRLTYLSTLATWEKELLARYQRDMEKLEQLQADQARVRHTLVVKKERVAKNVEVMKGIKDKKQTVLVSLKQKAQSHEHTLSTLQRAEERKESLLDELLTSSRKVDVSKKKPVVRLLKKGGLLWPAEGRVVAAFGRQKHPTFNTYINKKGIEIETAEGSEIKAAFGGEVVFADWLKGYGLVVIIDHRNGFFSLYAHASNLVVQEGDEVESGKVIGQTGASGLTDKNVLYFELRKGTQPVDPQQWLVRR